MNPHLMVTTHPSLLKVRVVERSVILFVGRREYMNHMDVVNADLAGANICPCRLDDGVPAIDTYKSNHRTLFGKVFLR